MSVQPLLQHGRCQMEEAFLRLDTGGSGTLSVDTLGALLEQLGMSTDFVAEAISRSGSQHRQSAEVDYVAFLEWLWGPAPQAEQCEGEQELQLHGVSLRHMTRDLKGQMQELSSSGFLPEYADATIRNIAPVIILPAGATMTCPRDSQQGAAYVDAIRPRAHGPHAQRATHMLSYTWSYKVCSITDALDHFCTDRAIAKELFYVWMCCFCINQHRVKKATKVPFEQFQAEFRHRVMNIEHMIALFEPWDAPIYLTRVWCVFEFFTVCKHKSTRNLSICIAPGQAASFRQSLSNGDIDSTWKFLANIDIRQAKASVEEDRVRILTLVEDEFGSEALNAEVADTCRKWLLLQTERLAVQSQRAKDAMQAGTMASRLNDKLRAARNFEHALRMLRLSNEMDSEIGADVCLRYGSLKGGERDVESQQALYQMAYHIREKIRALDTPSGASLLVGMAFAALGSEPEKASTYFKRALDIRRATGTEKTHEGANLLKGLAEALRAAKQPTQARARLEEALQIRISLDLVESPDGAKLLELLGDVTRDLGDLAGALLHYQQAVPIFLRVGHRYDTHQNDLALKVEQCEAMRAQAVTTVSP